MNANNRKGISKSEIMMSALILAVGILGLVPLVNSTVSKNSYSKQVAMANKLAQERIELLLNIADYGALPYWKTEDSVNGKFSIYSQVDDNSQNGLVPAGLYRISVRVYWSDEKQVNRGLNYSALKPKL